MTCLLFYSVVGFFFQSCWFPAGILFRMDHETMLYYTGISLGFIKDGGWRRTTSVFPLSETIIFLPENHQCVTKIFFFFLALPYVTRKAFGENTLFNANLLRIECTVLRKCKSVVYTDARKCKIRIEYVDFLSSNCISS